MQFPIMTPTPTSMPLTGEQVTDVIDAIDRTANTFQDFTIGLAALFVIAIFGIAIIAYFYFNRNASKGAQEMMVVFSQAMGSTLKEREERIDSLEAKEAQREERQNEGMMAVGDGLNRIADLWTAQQKRETERDRILSDAASAISAIVTVGSKPLQQVVKDVAALRTSDDEIKIVVSKIFDRMMLIFPSEKPMVDQIRDIIIDKVNEVSEQKKHATGELPPITDAPPAGESEAKDAA